MRPLSRLKLASIASRSVQTITVDAPLSEVVLIFCATRLSCLIVVEGDHPVGIVTERDLLRLISSGYDETRPVRAVMSAPLITARQDMDFATAQNMLSNRGVRHLVLVDAQGRLTGLVTETDFRRNIGTDLFDAIQHLGVVMDASGSLIPPDRTLSYVLETMASRRLDHVIVGEAGRALGILTERDVPRLMARRLATDTLAVSEVMSQPLITVRLDLPVAEAARRLSETGLRHLVVEDAAGNFAGVLSQHRLLERLSAVLLEEGHQHLARQVSQSEQRFRDFVEHLPIPLCHVDANGRLVYVNQRFTEALGYTLADVPEVERWWQVAYPDAAYRQHSQQRWGDAVRASMHSGEPIAPDEYRVTCKDGRVRIAEIGGITLGEELLVTFVDMTERREAEEQLRSQLDELRRWQAVMLDREDRVLALKQEVNELLARLGEPARYASVLPDTPPRRPA